jgi:hypothetical protein
MNDSVVALSCIISILIFTSVVVFGKIGPLLGITFLSLLSALWGWLAPSANEFQFLRIMLLLAIAFWIVFKRNFIITRAQNSMTTKIPFSILVVCIVLSSALLVSKMKAVYLYQLMFNGYDNYGHLAVFYRTYEMNGFEYSPRAEIANPNVLAANGYPLLVHSVWAMSLRLFGFKISSTDTLIKYFVFFSILSLLYVAYLLLLAILSKSKGVGRLYEFVCVFTVLLLVYFSQVSTLVVQGFPPTLAGVIFVISIFVLIKLDLPSNLKWPLAFANLILTGYSYQLFVPVALLGVTLFLISEFREIQRKVFFFRSSIYLFALFVSSIPLILVSDAIPSYLFAFGGIQTPHSLILLLVFIVNSSLFIIGKWDYSSLGYFFSTLLAMILIVWAKIGDVGYYYPIKIVYLSLVLGMLAIFTNFQGFGRNHRFQSKLLPLITITVTAILVANESSAFQNSTTTQIITSNIWKSPCIEAQFDAVASSSNFSKKNVIYVYANAGQISDLRTRQMNAMNGRWDNEIFNFSIPYGQSQDQKQFLKDYAANKPGTKFEIFNYSEVDCSLKKQ